MFQPPQLDPHEACRRLGERLRERRLRLRIPQEVLASRAGVSLGTIKNLETHAGSVSLENLVRVCGPLHLTGEIAGLFRWRRPTHEQWLAMGRPPQLTEATRQRARRPRRA